MSRYVLHQIESIQNVLKMDIEFYRELFNDSEDIRYLLFICRLNFYLDYLEEIKEYLE